MTDLLHHLIERYGLIVVLLGCMAEGESVAMLGGFFAHQHVFAPANAFIAAFLGAFAGDTAFFLAGRHFADRPFVARLRTRPGFRHAQSLVEKHPVPFVLLNRYAYGFRLVGGVAAGLTGMRLSLFAALNALSALVWAAVFVALGYLFGLGAEAVVGAALQRHTRLLAALALGIAAATTAGIVAHLRRQRHVAASKARPAPDPRDRGSTE